MPALVNKLMKYVNQDWMNTLQKAQMNEQILMHPETLRDLSHMIKTNTRVASSVGPGYLSYLQNIFNDLINVYKLYSNCISSNVSQGMGDGIMVRPMKVLRRDILKLLQTYIERETDFSYFNATFLPTLQALVEDYSSNDPKARDPEVLQLFATMMRQEGPMLQGFMN